MKAIRVLCMILMVIAMAAFMSVASADVWLPPSLTEVEAQAFMNAQWLSGSCVIPEGTQRIGAQAFMNCSGLTSLTIPDSVTSIGSQAFAGCTNLSGSVVIPRGCTVAANAFAGCTNLTVIYDEGDPSELFSWEISGGEVTITGYKGDKNVTSLTVPAQIQGCPVTAIADYVFASSRYLSHVSLPYSVRSIGNYAFAYCSVLTGVSLPSSVAEIGRYAFYYCSALEGMVEFIDATIPSNAFTGCKKLNVMAYTTNGDGTLTLARFYGSAQSVTVPSRVEGRQVTAIGREAFSYRTALESVSLPRGITTIGQSAFYYCSALKSIELPYGVTSVGASAFHSCFALETAVLPSSIRSIGSMAFYNCTALKGRYSFVDASVDASAFSTNGVEAWCYQSTAVNEACLTACISQASDIVVPASVEDYAVTSMAPRAFSGCPSLEIISLPASLKAIPAEAFYKCTTLIGVNIPGSVTAIGEDAFYGCSALYSVSIPASVRSVGTKAFYNCTSMTALTLNSSTTAIGAYAFAGCSALSAVTLPGNGSNVGNLAFNGTPWLNNWIAVLAQDVTRGCTTDYQKALVLHDWLTSNTAYDLSYTHYGSEGVLFHGLGVCNAYTLTYSRMLSAVGISSMTVTGTAEDKYSGNSGSHAWTLVLLDGSWYHVDTTWDDPIPDGNERHTYFCLTDEEMAADHTWNASDYPAANGTLYSAPTTAEAAADDAAAPAEDASGEKTLQTTTRNKRR